MQNEFINLLMTSSYDPLEVALPLTDEDRRDFEIDIHGQFGVTPAIQIKGMCVDAPHLKHP